MTSPCCLGQLFSRAQLPGLCTVPACGSELPSLQALSLGAIIYPNDSLSKGSPLTGVSKLWHLQWLFLACYYGRHNCRAGVLLCRIHCRVEPLQQRPYCKYPCAASHAKSFQSFFRTHGNKRKRNCYSAILLTTKMWVLAWQEIPPRVTCGAGKMARSYSQGTGHCWPLDVFSHSVSVIVIGILQERRT